MVVKIQKIAKTKKQTHTEKHLIQVPRGFANFFDIGSTYFNKNI
jgi:hypothetical protein